MRNINQEDIDLINSSPLFDANWYGNYYRDVAAIKMTPAYHFLWIGHLMNRNPSLLFSTKDYIKRYPDVAAANVNSLLHYIRYGKHEGRETFPVADILDMTMNVGE
ncbi:hypothetical protein LJR235_004529 [Pararhizobium sp. LjRoot235]|uniref:hypothetical protein n=1 Tax=Pararhizobium sp. LjRoot235 TaxID=3342291 RepID=UPI003ED0AAED